MPSTEPAKTWGGKRRGAGRPPSGDPPMETVAVRFTKVQVAWLSAQPDSFSVTLRRLVDDAMRAAHAR